MTDFVDDGKDLVGPGDVGELAELEPAERPTVGLEVARAEARLTGFRDGFYRRAPRADVRAEVWDAYEGGYLNGRRKG